MCTVSCQIFLQVSGKLLISLWLLVLPLSCVEDAFVKAREGHARLEGNRDVGYQLFPGVGFSLNTFKGEYKIL
jgi:hypothetical protein